ncbi:MAG: cytidine deaminase [Syntrophomonas sp.]|uniref:cytidine deaminase n=1 Tax=Syntrophomonas sp. TaxID=2053627 RepID=UPI00260E219C|nr:cytidine deaminase [Syntrophomonas sp.]MDD2510887.1 cytidine deaminase [Syntrophomonas sp.]MDD3879783.1 cytidine deaminase [Syntrophomonas sp.]MDD4625957.1 cytidine deaminase [Syntrophomonas sp.]
MSREELLKRAREAQKNAYAPYSNFQVGAALLSVGGKVYTGSNVENSSYGLSICAERAAVFKAVNAGERDFTLIAVVSSGQGYVFPCGACLQVLAEFSPQMKLIITDENDHYKEYALQEMLPQIFSLGKQEE